MVHVHVLLRRALTATQAQIGKLQTQERALMLALGTKPRVLSPEARQRLSEAAKKRWATKTRKKA